MRRDIVREDQHGRLAGTHEIARHGEDEVRIGPVHLRQEFLDHRHRDVGPAGDQRRAPARDVVLVEEIGHLRAEPARLRQHRGDDARGRPPQEVPDERAANAETHHHELVDAQVIHETEMIVRVGIPRPVDLEWAGGLPVVGVAQVRRDAAVLALELRDRVKRITQRGDRRVQSSAGDQEQREAGTRLLVADADAAFFVEPHRGSCCPRALLSKRAGGSQRRRGARRQ